MEWDFSPEDVVKGKVCYDLEQFRADLANELRMNLVPVTEEEFVHSYAVVYDLCHWLATGRRFPDFLAELSGDPAATRLAHRVREPMTENAAILGAILQRMIMDRVAPGTPLETAVRAAAGEHARAAAQMPPWTSSAN